MKWIILMSFVLTCNITVGQYRFRQVNEVSIEKSRLEVGDKCSIKLPSLKRRLQEVIKSGDRVSVSLSYLGLEEHIEFEGYVRRVMPNIPFELECEDQAYIFRRTNLNKSFKDTTLKEIVTYMITEVNNKFNEGITLYPDIPVVNFSKFRLDNVNAAQALQKLKEEYGLASYFRGKELFVGLAYQQNLGTVKYSLAWNVIESSLEERKAEDIILQVKVIGITKDNKKVSVEVGDSTGEQRTIYKYNISDKEQLRKIGNEEIQKLKYDGFDGTITTFLYPYAEPLMTADLRDPLYQDKRTGLYIIDSVKTTFGTSGARREIELGKKVSV